MKPVSIADEQTGTLASGIANHLRADETCSVLRDHVERTGRIVMKALTDMRTAKNPAWPA